MHGEAAWRLGVFLTAFAVMAAAESMAPRRARVRPRRGRWLENLSLSACNTVLVRLLVPAGLTGLAAIAWARGWGVLPRVTQSTTAGGLAAFVALDLWVYLQHAAMHQVPVLWRLHQVHHCDPDLDVTSGVRFHPGEILVSLALKAAAVVALGAPPIAVVVFEVVLNAAALFNHANVKLPLVADRLLRLVLVTPDMHRIHHSTHPNEQRANFGFNLPWWDRLFGTYQEIPIGGHVAMAIGLSDVPAPRSLFGLLRLPLRR